MRGDGRLPGDEIVLAIETSNLSGETGGSTAFTQPEGVPTEAVAPEGLANFARPGVALGVMSTATHATPSGSIDAPAPRRSARVLDVEPIALGEGAGGPRDDRMPAIARLCARRGITPRDIRCVAVSIGPGGYTAVRLAVTTARMIAFAVNARILAAPAAWVVARRIVTRHDAALVDRPQAQIIHGTFGVALASKGDDTFLTTFDAAGEPSGTHAAGTLVTAQSIHWPDVEVLVADRFLPVPIRDAATALGIEIKSPEFDPAALIEIAPKLRGSSLESLDAIYPREPEAVRKWRELGRDL
jgi:hypothetical protein